MGKRSGTAIVVSFILGVGVVSGIACSSKTSGSSGTTTATTAAKIGAAGGAVEGAGGVTVTVPPGALSGDQTITVSQSTDGAPPGYAAVSAVYVFGPDGLVFAKPVEVKIPYSGDPANVVLYWSRAAGVAGYDALPVTRSDGALAGQVTHFSNGFLGTASADAGGPSGDTDSGGTDGSTSDGSGSDGGSSGGCGAGCTTGTCCNNVCVDTTMDPANCGGCGKACASGQLCAPGGVCAAGG